jgi:digeranylgeranylglycerophospholipid reductase
MSGMMYDVVVVGAGPAGSIAARFAAQNGLSVLMLERDREPGIPVRCAEGISHSGVDQFIPLDERWISGRITGARLVAPDRSHVDLNALKVGMVIERRMFDRALADLACRHGAKLLVKADAIALERENDEICGVRYRQQGVEHVARCKLVIGADGVESMVGRWGGIDTRLRMNDIDTCVQYTLTGITVDPGVCEFHLGREIAPGGYIWIFPKSGSVANVGLGVAGIYAEGRSAREYLDDFVARRFPNAAVNYVVAGGVPTAVLKDISTDRMLLVGDAARQVNPMNGGGIINGMIAGRIASETAAEAIRANDFSRKFLKRYDKSWRATLGQKMELMYAMKEKFLRVEDRKLNNVIASCRKIPRDEFTVKALFTQAVMDDPSLVGDVAKYFLVDRIKIKR